MGFDSRPATSGNGTTPYACWQGYAVICADFVPCQSRQQDRKAKNNKTTHRSPSSRLTSSTVHPSGFRTLAITLSESGRKRVIERTGGDVTYAHEALEWLQSGA
jgi:hypothetical protein